MLRGLFTLQEEYLRYCVRKGLDPAAALPSLASLDDALSSVTNSIRAKPDQVAIAEPPDTPRAEGVRKNSARKSKDGRRFSEHARRFLDLRSEGFDLKKRHEMPDTKAGQRFTKTSRANYEGTVRIFLEAHGDIFVENIDEGVLADFFSLLDRIPAPHGKSSKDRRPVRQVSLRVWYKQAQRDAGKKPGPTGAEKARIKELEREVRELRQANEILKKASAYFAQAELDRPFRR